jgi:hypothetical protein
MKPLLYIIALLVTLSLSAQQVPTAYTYVHIDKNIYMPGETLWFKAYLPSTSQKINDTFLIRLIDDRNKIIVAREFPVYDIRSHGQLILPDTLAAGQYRLMGYGNHTGVAAGDVFVQNISVINNTTGVPVATAAIRPAGGLLPGNTITVNFSLMLDGRPVVGAKGTYAVQLQSNDALLFSNKLKTDTNGQATATFTYPQAAAGIHVVITGTFETDKQQAVCRLVLPLAQQKIVTTVVPEGGALAMGVKNRLVITVATEDGKPVKGASVQLRQNGAAVAAAVTNVNGLATIEHTIENASYSIATSAKAENFSAEMPLPQPVAGLSLLLQGGNTLMIRNPGAAQSTRFELWSHGQVLYTKQLTLPQNDSLPVRLPPSAEKMIISACLFNAAGTLTNERVFYTGTQDAYTITADFGTQKSQPRQKVIAHITVTDAEGNPVQANLSAAVVLSRLLEKDRYKTITASRYSAIADATTIQPLLSLSPAGANALLAAKSYRQNTPVKPVGITAITAGLKGSFNRHKNKPVVLKQLVLITPAGPQPIPLNPDGSFYITPQMLLTDEGAQNYLFFSNGELKDHTVTFARTGADFDTQWLAAMPAPQPVFALQSAPETLPTLRGTNLRELVIEKETTRFTNADYQKWMRDFAPRCSDWICYRGEINCRAHNIEDRTKKPIVGQHYLYNGREILYTQCIDSPPEPDKIVNVKSITLPQAFPTQQFEDALDLTYYTTTFWSPNIDTDAAGKATIEFTPSDTTGNFSLIIQGIDVSNSEAIYGEASLKVGE